MLHNAAACSMFMQVHSRVNEDDLRLAMHGDHFSETPAEPSLSLSSAASATATSTRLLFALADFLKF